MQSKNSSAKQLLDVISDSSSSLTEKDDAIIALREHDDKYVIFALHHIACDSRMEELLLASAGESLGYIWVRSGAADVRLLRALQPVARMEAEGLLKHHGIEIE